jgi:Ca2+/H+ antiporter, TMEM165/GDT1 family
MHSINLMFEDIIIPFIAVGLAEFGDKTQIAILCLASNTKKYVELLLGIILAFIITDGLAILLGNFITSIVPLIYLKIISGVIFIIFGILTLMAKKEESKCELGNPFMSGFSLILISEMGDKTQIASGLFATKFNPFLVFIGVISSLFILSVIAIYFGQFITKKFDKKKISMIAGTVFILIGISCFFT